MLWTRLLTHWTHALDVFVLKQTDVQPEHMYAQACKITDENAMCTCAHVHSCMEAIQATQWQ